MSGGDTNSNHVPDGKPQTFDFEQDNRLVYSAFRARYDVNLTRERLHWFAFLAMLGDLGGCSLSEIIGIRNTDLAKLSDEQRRKYAAMQERYRIKPQMSDADKAILAEFEERLKD